MLQAEGVGAAAGMPVAVTLLLVGAFLCFGVAVAVARTGDRTGALPLVVLLVAIAVWCGSYAAEIAVPAPTAKTHFHSLSYVCIALIPVAWFTFAVEYTGRGPQVTPAVGTVLLLVPLTTSGLAIVGHPALFADVSVSSSGLRVVDTGWGPWFGVHAVYSYLLVAGGTAILAVSHVVANGAGRGATRSLILAAVVPLVANLAFLAGVTPTDLDPTPFGFIVSGALFGLVTLRDDLFVALPVAREVARDTVVESLDDGILVLDDHGRVVDYNGAAADLFEGLDVGVNVADVGPLGGVLDDLPAMVELRRGETPRQYEVEEGRFARGSGLLTGRVVKLHDVTRRQRQRQRLSVLNRVLRHDLRNDLNVIRGHADLLREEPTLESESPRVIHEQSNRLVELADKVRAAEETLGGTERHLETVDLASMAADRARTLRREQPFVEVSVDSPPYPVRARASKLLEMAVDNLLENAAEHNDTLSPTVEVTARRVGDDRVELSVVDDGPGIPEHERSTLTSGSETPLEHGSGMGLWLVNWIVEESAGELRIEDNEPRGSVVGIQLPSAPTGRRWSDETADPGTSSPPTADTLDDDGRTVIRGQGAEHERTPEQERKRGPADGTDDAVSVSEGADRLNGHSS